MPCANKCRASSDAAASQGISENASKPLEARRRPWRTPLWVLEGASVADTLILKFQPPELQDNTFLLLATQYVVLSYGNPRIYLV